MLHFIYSSNKPIKNGEIQFSSFSSMGGQDSPLKHGPLGLNSIYCKISIYVHKILFPPQFYDIGANFSLQLSSRTQFAKIGNKMVIAENQCEKHKNPSMFFLAN